MKTKPIKRNKNLVVLSKDHHFGLLACWKVRQGINKEIEPDKIRKYILYFWDNHLDQHFQDEERLLFDKNEKTTEALQQHQAIRDHIQLIRNAPIINPPQLNDWADLLDKHIRFEERELFPYLEQILPEERLKEIGQALLESHQEPMKDAWDDTFWERGGGN